jgi:hypothetical protein
MPSRFLIGGLVFAAALTLGADPASGELAVSGTVLAGPDRPLAGARIELVRVLPAHAAEPAPALAETQTGADGRFALLAPESGAFAVVVRFPSRAPMRFGDFILTRSRELPPLILLAATDTTVRLTDAAGRPLADAWVAMMPPASEMRPRAGPAWRVEPRIARTGADGTAVLPVLQGERMEVEVHVPGMPAMPAIWRAVPDNGAVPFPRDLRPTALRVTRAGGEPVEGVLLRVGAWSAGVTDSSGNLTLRLPAGASLPGELHTPEGIAMAVRLGGQEPIRLQLPLPKTVKGRVLDAVSGKGLAGALVAPAADLGAVTKTGDDGRFSVAISADETWVFEAHANGYLPTRLAVPPGELKTGRLPAVSLDPAAGITGRVLGAGNQPLSGVLIEAIPEGMLAARPFSPSEPVSDRGASAADGTFHLSGLRPSSRYELRARKAGHLPAAVMIATAPPRGRAAAAEIRLQPGRAAVGRVVDPDGRPIPGARVLLRPSRREGSRPPETHAEPPLAEDDPASALSRPDGRFEVAQCPAAELDAEIRREGYAPVRRVGLRTGSGTGPVDLGTLVLRPGARLGGRVVNDSGKAVTGAEVFLFERFYFDMESALLDRKPDATTSPDGSFALTDLPAGFPQHLFVRAEGFLPATVRGVRPPSSKPLLVRLEKGFEISGMVVDEQDQPVPRADIGLTSQPSLAGDPYRRPLGRRVSREAVSDETGRFVIRDAPEGLAEIGASARGFIPAEGIEIEVPRPDRSQLLVVRLRSGQVLWGRISTSAGDAVADARVLAGDAAGTSDAEGFYRISGVAESRQQILVQHPDYRSASRTVQVEPGENRLDFELPAGVPVAGRVLGSAGDPVAGAEVRLGVEQGRERRQYRSRSDADGGFRFETVAAGAYRLEVTAPDRSSGALPQPVVVESEPVSGLEVVLETGAVLSGRVLGVTPDELASVSVEARGADGKVREARLDAGGMYRIPSLAPGDWLVRATLWQGQKEARARVVVAPSDREITRDLELGRKLTLSGRVLFDDEPLPDAVLTVRGQRLAVERTVVTGFEGTFLLEDLEPDSYLLGISKPDQLLAHNERLDLLEDREVTIRLAAGTVSGRVRDAQKGEAIAGALIRLRPTEGPEFLILDSSQEDGSFHLLRVPPGSYRLQVSADGFVGTEQPLRVAAGEAVAGLDLPLQPTAGGLLQVALAAGGIPHQVNLLALDAAGRPVIAETRSTDSSGRVRLATLPPGSWQLLVSAPGTATVSRAVVLPGDPVSVTLPQAGRLRLRVPVLAAGDLLATVKVVGPDQQPLWILGPGGQLQGSWPMMAGQATIDGIPQGVWLLRVESADGHIWNGSVAVSGGGELAVTLN